MSIRLGVTIGLAAVVVALAVTAFVISSPRGVNATIAAGVSEPGDPAAGKNVFFIAGCDSCHMTPGQKDPLRLGGGLPMKSPFGTFHPPNISPDRIDGIGSWTAADFASAVMAGVSPTLGHLYPAMPYPSYSRMSVKDVRDLYAFLRTAPPVAGRAPPNEVDFPFSIRRGIGFWNLLYMPKIDPPSVAPTGEEALGRYLVEGPGHCAECHSPHNFLGAAVERDRLTGGRLLDGRGKAPNITAQGLKDWSEDDITEALSTGFTPTGDALGSDMALVVRSLSHASASDLAAIAHFLKSYNQPQR